MIWFFYFLLIILFIETTIYLNLLSKIFEIFKNLFRILNVIKKKDVSDKVKTKKINKIFFNSLFFFSIIFFLCLTFYFFIYYSLNFLQINKNYFLEFLFSFKSIIFGLLFVSFYFHVKNRIYPKKNLQNYNFIAKLFYSIVFNFNFINIIFFKIEKLFFLKNKNKNKKLIFISGLARCGSTALLNLIHSSDLFSSLKYSNMPIILSPNIWGKISKFFSSKHNIVERYHNDGIAIHENSPESFEEVFWKIFLEDKYVCENKIKKIEIQDKYLKDYENFIELINLSEKKNYYISKNNLNIIRYDNLSNFFYNNSIFFVIFREPINHSYSLYKFHKNFKSIQSNDDFGLDYMNYLGHYEGGLNHKIIEFEENLISYEIDNPNYWLVYWINFYESIAKSIEQNKIQNIVLLSYEEIAKDNNKIKNYLSKYGITETLNFKEHFINKNKKKIPLEFDEINCIIAKKLYKKLINQQY